MNRLPNWLATAGNWSSPSSEATQSGQPGSIPLNAPDEEKEPKPAAGKTKAHPSSFGDKPFGDYDPLAFNDEEEIYKEPQPWWDGQEGPLSREDFDTYKDLNSARFKEIRLDKLETVRQCDERLKAVLHDKIEALRLKDAEIELGNKRIEQMRLNFKREQETFKVDSINLRKFIKESQFIERKEVRERWGEGNRAERQQRRGLLHEPKYTPGDGRQKLDERCLYDNEEDTNIELKVRSLLMQTQNAFANNELRLAEQHVDEAFEEARLLEYVPIEAHCAFWKGRVALAAESYEIAEVAFWGAIWAKGFYEEGTNTGDWIKATQIKKNKLR